ncbi:Fibroblast growth factor receptor 1 [Exaiptasia diaphana]|nr:Fibroblast growth factor receptor 1 [Exaiptasia diaphana]
MKESYPKSYFNLGNSFTISENCTVFSRERFALLYEVGSGEFGVVYRGQLLNDNNEFIDCAVKTYKETASDEDVRDLYQELDIMVNIGRHKNLVNVIGACEEPGKRKGRDQLYLLVEFAQHGSLISYLKEHRENPTENPEFELHYMNRLKLAHGVA